jgi:hypothetical protein
MDNDRADVTIQVAVAGVPDPTLAPPGLRASPTTSGRESERGSEWGISMAASFSPFACQQLTRRGISEMDVVEREHERTVFRQLLKQRPSSAMKTKTFLLHDHHRRRDKPLHGRKHPSELRHALRIQLLARTLYEQPEVSVERIDEQAIREIALELGGAATQHQPAGPVWLPHSLEQRGLANFPARR